MVAAITVSDDLTLFSMVGAVFDAEYCVVSSASETPFRNGRLVQESFFETAASRTDLFVPKGVRVWCG